MLLKANRLVVIVYDGMANRGSLVVLEVQTEIKNTNVKEVVWFNSKPQLTVSAGNCPNLYQLMLPSKYPTIVVRM